MAYRSFLRALVAIAALTASWLVMGGSGSPALATTPIPYGIYSITSPSIPRGCVGAVDWGGSRPMLFTCDAFDPRQQWEFRASPSPGAPATYRQIRNVYYNLCIDASFGVVIRDCGTSATQAWDFKGGWISPGQGYACAWSAPNCDVKLEWVIRSGDGLRVLTFVDKWAHNQDQDIWYVWKNLPPRPWS
jgi:hypothetical protein